VIALSLSAADLAWVAAIVFGAAVVQVLSGFGFGLMTVPLMTLVVSTREAVVVSTLLGIGLSTWQAWKQRADAVRPLVLRLTAGAYVGMPFGLWVFVAVDDHTLRLLLGIAVLISVVLLVRRINLRHVGPALDLGAGVLSGVLNTSLSTNGPPLVFVLQSRHLEPPAFRGTISQVFAFSNVVGLTLFLLAGKVTSEGVVAAAVALPALVLGQIAGYPLRRHVHGERFRWLVLVLLTAAAISAIVSALGQ
jgi:uncharacterized membrane protein YfcA